jgi:hypothetical protein
MVDTPGSLMSSVSWVDRPYESEKGLAAEDESEKIKKYISPLLPVWSVLWKRPLAKIMRYFITIVQRGPAWVWSNLVQDSQKYLSRRLALTYVVMVAASSQKRVGILYSARRELPEPALGR